jgi:hypothetical protein
LFSLPIRANLGQLRDAKPRDPLRVSRVAEGGTVWCAVCGFRCPLGLCFSSSWCRCSLRQPVTVCFPKDAYMCSRTSPDTAKVTVVDCPRTKRGYLRLQATALGAVSRQTVARGMQRSLSSRMGRAGALLASKSGGLGSSSTRSGRGRRPCTRIQRRTHRLRSIQLLPAGLARPLDRPR